MNKLSLLSVEDSLTLDRKQTRELHKSYSNPGLTTMLSLLGFDRQFVRAEGVSVWDNEGEEYLDFLGGYGSLNLGHNPPEVISAIDLITTQPNIMKTSLSPVAGALAYNLAQITPGELQFSFFCNSGAEAVEGALKLARAATGKKKIIYTQDSFHGKTMGALSVTGREKYQTLFLPLVPQSEGVRFNDLAHLEEKLKGRDVAGVILEPIQGEGGVNVPEDGYLQGVRRLCDTYGALMICDEVQTGFGRTGYMFACEHEEVTPDILCLAKALGGGVMPLGAFVSTDKAWNAAYGSWEKSTIHTSTFGGNTWAMAAGVATINSIIAQDLPQKARDKGEQLMARIGEMQKNYPLIKEVRGRGLLIGIEFEKPSSGMLNKLTGGKINQLSQEYTGALVAGELLNNHKIITAYTLNNPNVIRIEPPLTVTDAQLDRMVTSLEAVLEKHKGFLGIALSSTKNVVGSLFKR